MQPCESQGYIVDTGVVIGFGSDKDMYTAATKAQNDAIAKIKVEVKAAIAANTETCQSGCQRQYRPVATPTPAYGVGGPPYALQMAVHWVLYMDCVRKEIEPPKPPAKKKRGKIYIGPVGPTEPHSEGKSTFLPSAN
jgi:hypothetical protein